MDLFKKLTVPQQEALRTFAATAGANWRAMLIDCWINDDNPILKELEARIGGHTQLWKIKTSDLRPVPALDMANERIDRAHAALAAAQAELRAAIDAKIELLRLVP